MILGLYNEFYQKRERLGIYRRTGYFFLEGSQAIRDLYFPLCNEAGLMSSLTPELHGDSKSDQSHFLLSPVMMEDLHNTRSARNFWVYAEGKGVWSATGNSARQNAGKFEKKENSRTIKCGFLWHELNYEDRDFGLSAKIRSFIPADNNLLEIMTVMISNISQESFRITPTSSIPLFGRSAENIRDHRHVTSLLNRVKMLDNGFTMKPLIDFDERLHRFNETYYYILGCEGDGTKSSGIFPVVTSFIGERGSYDWPEAVVKNLSPADFQGESADGKECAGAIRFHDKILKPGESADFILLFGISSDESEVQTVFRKYSSKDKINEALKNNREFWQKKADAIEFGSGLPGFSNWMKWVGVQPVFRKIFGCSFLPYHDYGKGGRGWRDLWQDCLTLMLQNPEDVRELLAQNFCGIRIDGTNATIIGQNPGEFKADRNGIPRVWMDHGCWPYLTTRLYIDQTGDLDFIFQKKPYFRDALIKRAEEKDEKWESSLGTLFKMKTGEIYEGSILEHILVQNLTSFFNVGEHNIIRLEGADWNDAVDMASKRGESVSFSAFYAGNLIDISALLLKINKIKGINEIELFEELILLIDTIKNNADYGSIEYKKALLSKYFDNVSGGITGKKIIISISELADDLRKKGEWLISRIRRNEWVKIDEDTGFFNSYYNNDGENVDGLFGDNVIMNLTGQTFSTMFNVAEDEKVLYLFKACNLFLRDPKTGGFRLNMPLGKSQLNFGRVFAYIYGEKENGSVFCHMASMFMNALYKRGFVKEAYEVFRSLFDLSMDSEKAKIYPGIPEYFTPEGKGMYPYLTGSASWILLTVLQEMYGVKGELGALLIEPKLVLEQFDTNGHAAVNTMFQERKIRVEYNNHEKLDYGEYKIVHFNMNNKVMDKLIPDNKRIKIPLNEFISISNENIVNQIEIELDS